MCVCNFPTLLFYWYIDTSYMHSGPLAALYIRTHARARIGGGLLCYVIVFASRYSSCQNKWGPADQKYESVSVRTGLWSQNNVWTTQWSAPGRPQIEWVCGVVCVVKGWCLWWIVTWKWTEPGFTCEDSKLLTKNNKIYIFQIKHNLIKKKPLY